MLDIETDGCRGRALRRYEVTHMYRAKDLLTVVGEVYLVTSLEERVHVRQASLFLSQWIRFSLRLLFGLFDLTQSVHGRVVYVLHLVDGDDGEDGLV